MPLTSAHSIMIICNISAFSQYIQFIKEKPKHTKIQQKYGKITTNTFYDNNQTN